MITMNDVGKALFAAALGLGVGSIATPSLAQTAAPAASAESGRFARAASQEERQARRAARIAKRAERHAQRQAALRDSLKLTAAQESAWTTYVNATKPVPHAAGDRALWSTLSAPARLEQRLAMARERTARMETRLSALTSLYAVLTPEQKKTFDEATAKRGRHGHHGRHGHQGGDRMPG